MKKIHKSYKYFLVLFLWTMSSCNDQFLDRPPQDAYTIDNWYQDEEQLKLAVNPLYGGVWFDYQRSFTNIGDVYAGNYTKPGDAFYVFGVNNATGGLTDAYASLWMGVTYSSGVIENIREKAAASIPEATKNKYLGEAMVWKAMAYFYLVRGWGAVPIIESNSKLIASGEISTLYRNKKEDVYEYIVRLLKKAGEILPETNESGRINKWSAYGLLAKVYLTRSGVNGSGSRKQADLDEAKKYAGMVINNSGLQLWPEYSELFTISKGNRNPENLISWHWAALPSGWGEQNAMQADLAVQQLSGVGDGWGTWSGPSVYLQSLFNEDATKTGTANRQYTDKRRKATIIMDGDYYPELDRARVNFKNGFTMTWDGGSIFATPTGAHCRKHVVGSKEDHKAESGKDMYFMKTVLSTHLLRLADIYLVYAEAILGNSASTSDAEALQAFNTVRKRAIPNHVDYTSLTFDDIFKERRLELAMEGDNWYDYVRLYYYNPTLAKSLLSNQERGTYSGNAATLPITLNSTHYTPKDSDFELPIPEVDILINPNLTKEPVAYDFSKLWF